MIFIYSIITFITYKYVYNVILLEIPDLLGPMIFPTGMSLSNQERKPYSFTFVLTNVIFYDIF